MILRYFYGDSIAQFIKEDEAHILGQLTNAHSRMLASLQDTQIAAWRVEIDVLRHALAAYAERGHIFFEYSIPRMGRRIDVALLIDGRVVILEFKVGATQVLRQDIYQVWDYALDLKNFHEASHNRVIVPVLVATDCHAPSYTFVPHNDEVYRPIVVNAKTLPVCITDAVSLPESANTSGCILSGSRSTNTLSLPGGVNNTTANMDDWALSRYSPTPTIIEAASVLYNHHSVEDISRSDATAKNLTDTCQTISHVIAHAKAERFKAICFVTGVPGAGKTLVGLNIATHQSDKDDIAVYLSGNFPLVQVLTEALARDKCKRTRETGGRITITDARSQVKAFIQMIHHYRDTCFEGAKIVDGEIVIDESYYHKQSNSHKSFTPVDHVAVFDEAQRAWTQEALANFMKRKKGVNDFPYSEPEYLISCLDRHDDWAVIVCLVGGGQEINTGEAGISEWIESLNRHFRDWHVYVSDRLKEDEYAAGKALDLLREHDHVIYDSSLHLSVPMRSFRAENLAKFVQALLDIDLITARSTLHQLDRYPLLLTRNLNTAKLWLRQKARGSERYGMIVSSQAQRLKPLAIDVRLKPDVVHWFLDDDTDVRSSFYLEDVATEFDVQGLELDWACVVWDGDFRYTDHGWTHHAFVGDKWQNINKHERRAFQKNAYRVLLTRARQGMIIVVPEGNVADHTRLPIIYDSTYHYLRSIGIPEI